MPAVINLDGLPTMMFEIEIIVISLSLFDIPDKCAYVQKVKLNSKNRSDTILIREIRFLLGT